MTDIKFRADIVLREQYETPILNGGVLKLHPVNLEYAQLVVNGLRGYDGRDFAVTIKDSDSWTDRMNRLFHALVRDIVQDDAVQYWQLLGRAPSGFEEVKEWCKVQFGGAEVKIVGSLSFIKSWTDFNKKEAIQTIDNMINYCLEQGVDIDAHILERDNLRGEK